MSRYGNIIGGVPRGAESRVLHGMVGDHTHSIELYIIQMFFIRADGMSMRKIAKWLEHECSKVKNRVTLKLRCCHKCRIYKKWSSMNLSAGRNSTSTNITFLDLDLTRESQENGYNENMENSTLS